MYVIRSVSDSGDRFYTGRAGDGWVSDDLREAFRFDTLEHARWKARAFNRNTALHGERFSALHICPHCGVTLDMDQEQCDYCRMVGDTIREALH